MNTPRRSAFRLLALLPFALISAAACGGKSFNADGGGASGSAGASGTGIAGGGFAGSGATGNSAGSSAGGSAGGGPSNGGSANGGSANGGSANGGSANGGSANGGTGGASIYTCVENTDCVIEPVSCCSCGSGPITDYTAINSKYVDQYNPSCKGISCGACPPIAYDLNHPHFYYVATCQAVLTVGDKVVHECRAADIRNSTDITSCKANADCTLRGGTACCQGCATQAVAINSSKEAELESLVCPSQAFGCAACAPNTNGLGAACLSGQCSVQSTPCTVQHPCPL